MKFGYAVTGMIDPRRVYTNAGAQPGDVLLLTKPIGTGVITTAIKQGKAEGAWIEAAVRSMTTLNQRAASIVSQISGVHAMTDVTGFGLMGHAREVAMASRVLVQIETAKVPRIEGALDAIALGALPGGLLSNREYAECVVSQNPSSAIAEALCTLMFDPQTSGGLLISVSEAAADRLLRAMQEAGVRAVLMGKVLEGKPGIVLQ